VLKVKAVTKERRAKMVKLVLKEMLVLKELLVPKEI
jgi:hypothetical protein